jgi:hypothetical protein
MNDSTHTASSASPSGRPKPRLRLLTFNDPTPLRIDRRLAMEIGFLESIVLLQIEYLISISKHEHEGQVWTYQTLQDLKDIHFPWLSVATISRTVAKLEDAGLLIVANYNRSAFDRTRWFALDYDGIERLKSVAIGEDAPILQFAKSSDNDGDPFCNLQNRSQQDANMDFANCEHRSQQDGTTIPNITTEITSETTTAPPAEEKAVVVAIPASLTGTNSLIDRLTEQGVTRTVAEELTTQYPDRIEPQIAMLPHRKPRDPGATLAQAIREDWSPPAAYLATLKAQQRAVRPRLRPLETAEGQKAASGLLNASGSSQATAETVSTLEDLRSVLRPARARTKGARDPF